MSKSQRSTTRNQLSRSRKGKAPWRTFTFYYREPNQDGIPSIWNHASTLATQRPTVSDYAAESETSSQHVAYTRPLSAVGYNGISLQPPTMTANEGAPEVPAGPKSARLESLRLELEDLQAQVQLRRHHRLKVEAMTKAVSPEARLECEKAILQRELANEQALAATFEVKISALRDSIRPLTIPTADDTRTAPCSFF